MKKTKKHGLEVKRYWSPDIFNPWGWQPENNEVFYLLEMDIGIIHDDSSSAYSVMIATPEGISSKKDINEIFNKAYKMILLDEYSWEKVIGIINSILSKIDTSNQFRIQDELNRYFYWEYQSMK
jgi:hypothetical protein